MGEMETFYSLAALEAVNDPKSPHWRRHTLLMSAMTKPDFKFANLTGEFMGVDETGHPVITVPNAGDGYTSPGPRSGQHSEDPWADWVDVFDFSLLKENTHYFFLCVADPERTTKKGRAIRYPILLVSAKHPRVSPSRWSFGHNEMCKGNPVATLDEVRTHNEEWLNSPA